VLAGQYDGRFAAPDLRLTAISLDGLWEFAPGAAVSPCLTAGLGVLTADPDRGATQDNFLLQGGVGAFVHLWHSACGTSLSLVPEAKIRWDTADACRRPVDLMAGLGLRLAFGGPRTAAAVQAPAPPAAPPPLKGTITLDGVRFETGSSRLTAASLPVLDRVAESLKAYTRLKVEVQGYTDLVASRNTTSSCRSHVRKSVRGYLLKQGAAPEQLTAHGYGETQPVADSHTAQGRAQNRRVVLAVLSKPDDVDVKRAADDR
jgi:outer membrane protein OmpA-like peptidoglycan-associated protein